MKLVMFDKADKTEDRQVQLQTRVKAIYFVTRPELKRLAETRSSMTAEAYDQAYSAVFDNLIERVNYKVVSVYEDLPFQVSREYGVNMLKQVGYNPDLGY